MADEKENMHEGKIFRRSKRRSSILKESPGRKPLENMTEKHQQRRSKRVSFADTKTIKEFLAVAGSGTEWNSTYEATASCDSSNSMDITCMGERSNRSIIITPNDKPATGSDKKETLDSSAEESLGFVRDILDWDSSKCASGTVWDPFDEPEEVVPTNDSFLTSFLNMKSSDFLGELDFSHSSSRGEGPCPFPCIDPAIAKAVDDF
ncbi:uncharacterized protein [Palaemon carinicauda]|uniref:uncharacterized protein n=1 Tax=Palaemon carinicauda TaxID=392227 RepID=UPI0035B66AC6